MTQDQPDFADREFRVSRYLDGDLSEAELRDFERELESDPQLARLVEEYRHTDRLVRTLRGCGPEFDWERFGWEAQRRREIVRATRSRAVRRQAPLAAAAMLALVCIGYLALRSGQPEPSRLDRRVLVQVQRPIDVVLVSGVERTVVVRANRTPPPGYIAPGRVEKSYLIATAGARPIETSESAVDAGPFF